MTEVKIELDSINSKGERLTTVIAKYPRVIHSQVMSHRAFSRNAASSRAIPTQKLIDVCNDEPFFPLVWQKNISGMSGGGEFTDEMDIRYLNGLWERARLNAVDSAEQLLAAGVHKQWVNRTLEPFTYITTIITGGTEAWTNFFNQRRGHSAQPEIAELAELIYKSYNAYSLVKEHEVHAPLTTLAERESLTTEQLMQLSVARCARVSYLNHDGTRPDDRDYKLFEKLKIEGHWSPFEHAAIATPGIKADNFTGWTSYRRLSC